MSERKPGWYWVKWPNENKWCVAQYIGRVGERLMWSSGDIIQADAPDEIGHRIPAPDEPWQTVPVEPTYDMMQAGYWSGSGDVSINEGWARREVWKRMLAAAPNPENS